MRPLVRLLPFLLLAGPLAGQTPAPVTLTLPGAIAMGRQRGVAGALARLNERIADSRVGQRRADLLPSISLGAGATHQTVNIDEFGIPFAKGVTDPFTVWRFQVRASETLYDASTLSRYRAAKDSALASGADARAVGELVAASAGLAYLRALSAGETVRAREADSVVAASLLDQAQQLVSAGVSAAIDGTRSEVQLASVLTQLEVARNSHDRALLDLARTLDLAPETPLILADSLVAGDASIPGSPEAAVAFALEHRAELEAERSRTRGIERSLKAIGYEYLPSLSLSGGYTQSGASLNTLAGSYNVGIQLSLPLLDGLRRPARQQEQAARLEAQQLRQHDLERQVATDTRQALLDLSSADHQVQLATDRLRLAERELSQARDRFAAGVAGTVETTSAQGGLIAARDGLIQAHVNAAVSRILALKALGILEQLK
ncbi:MAG: TolC family protein [Gemmatimonadota bacterium]